MYLNEILPGNWREDEWPEHIEVSHESSRFKSRRYVPRVNSRNMSSANPPPVSSSSMGRPFTVKITSSRQMMLWMRFLSPWVFWKSCESATV